MQITGVGFRCATHLWPGPAEDWICSISQSEFNVIKKYKNSESHEVQLPNPNFRCSERAKLQHFIKEKAYTCTFLLAREATNQNDGPIEMRRS